MWKDVVSRKNIKNMPFRGNKTKTYTPFPLKTAIWGTISDFDVTYAGNDRANRFGAASTDFLQPQTTARPLHYDMIRYICALKSWLYGQLNLAHGTETKNKEKL